MRGQVRASNRRWLDSGKPILVVLLSTSALSASACDFFKELEDDPGATDGADDGMDTDAVADTDGADGGPCTYVDDYCSGQDVIESCSPDTGEVTTVSCAASCGSYLNFTCLEVGGGQHGCWCVAPGKQKLDGCPDLEACLADCDPTSQACADACFGRTDASTIRLYGALLHCAESDCKPLCDASYESCASCVVATKSGLYGGCSVERAACDQDQVDDFPWPN